MSPLFNSVDMTLVAAFLFGAALAMLRGQHRVPDGPNSMIESTLAYRR